jgi:osmotically-inducible protein OsmY
MLFNLLNRTLILWGVLMLSGCTPLIIAGGATGYVLATDPRPTSQLWDDKAFQVRAYNTLAKESIFKATDQSHITITVFNGIVLLTGEVLTQDMSAKAQELIGALEGHRTLINRLTIEAPSSFWTRTQDTLLSTSVKASLLVKEDISAMALKTHVEKGEVFLLGKVTRTEASAITEAVSQVAGVRKVVKIFDYQN